MKSSWWGVSVVTVVQGKKASVAWPPCSSCLVMHLDAILQSRLHGMMMEGVGNV